MHSRGICLRRLFTAHWPRLPCSLLLIFWATAGVAQLTTVITAEDMERLGVESVADMIAQLPANQQAAAVPDPITETETALVREAMRNTAGAVFLDSDVLSFTAWRRYTEDETFTLEGHIWETPVFAQQRICVTARHDVEGVQEASGYEWTQSPFVSTVYWPGQSEQDCELDETDYPYFIDGAVWTSDLIPTDAMIQIVEGSDRLLQAMLEHPYGERFRDNEADLRVSSISLATSLDPRMGIGYHAMVSTGRSGGPSITFAIANGEFVIHNVGFWVA